ncbi:hypothetical protein K2Z84_12945 [Candidatus Binatia bacterium]|nr:hypothetical protein [Candidatus Binatia bacterium]
MFARSAARNAPDAPHDPGTEAPRFANDGTRAVLERILDDLLRRIDERTIVADDAAAIVGRLRAFCSDPPPHGGVRSLHELRDVLDPQRFAERARKLAAGYARLAAPPAAKRAS